jgi:3-hydroxybutyryl-CoA dehydrogenase
VYEQTYQEPRFAPHQVQRALVDAGRLGRKSGAGFYDYGDGVEPREPSTVGVAALAGPVTVTGDLGWAGPLVDRLRKSAATLEFVDGPGPGHLRVNDVAIVPTDGRSAGALAAAGGLGTGEVVVLDLFRPDATRCAVARPLGSSPGSVAAAAAVLQSAGFEVSEIADVPGLALMRIVSQLASVAADAALVGIAEPADIDLAMRLGTNYPAGPLEWADELGVRVVLEVLENLQAYYGEDRYRPSPALRQAALAGRTLAGNGDIQ